MKIKVYITKIDGKVTAVVSRELNETQTLASDQDVIMKVLDSRDIKHNQRQLGQGDRQTSGRSVMKKIRFGLSVLIMGLVGVPGWTTVASGNTSGTPSTPVFEQQKLLASTGAEYDYFGYPVSVDGDIAVVGAYGDDTKGSESGAVYVFRKSGTTWVEEAKLTALDGEAYDCNHPLHSPSGELMGIFGPFHNGLTWAV